MAKTIIGLSDAEQEILNELVDQLAKKGRRNRIRTAYADGKRSARALSPMLPPYLRNCGAVLGWPAKSVEALSRRVRLNAFALPGRELSEYGIDSLLDQNHYFEEVRLTEQDSLTHAVAWEIATRGGPGEPDAVITSKSALDGTGQWNKRSRRLDSFLSVIERKNGEPTEFNLYFPGVTVMVSDGRVQDRSEHQLHVPVEPIAYRRSHERPFGHSRISRPVMFLTDAAVRAMLRMEGTADFYGTPHLLLLGASLDQFSGADGSAVSTWDFLMSKINGLPDDDGAMNARAQVHEVTQATQQPHMDSLDTIAAAFAGETNIPVSSLGVGVKQANPTSADSYLASREDLIADAEDTAASWGHGHVRTLQNAWLLASGETELPDELRKLRTVYRDPRHTSRAAAADSTVKLIGAMPWLAESDAILDAIGLDAGLVERLRADKRRNVGRDVLNSLRAAAAPPEPVVEEDADRV